MYLTVLCELMYYWFSFEGAKVLDVFAGGSVRGIVAQMLNRDYTGIDLSKEQIEQRKGKDTGRKIPNWIAGNSMNVKSLAPRNMILSSLAHLTGFKIYQIAKRICQTRITMNLLPCIGDYKGCRFDAKRQ